MRFRAATGADLEQVVALIVPDAGCRTVSPESYREKLANGQYRLDRTWVAQDAAGRVRAVAVWWGAGERAQALDGVFGEVGAEVAGELLRAAHRAFGTAPAYHVFLPPQWRTDPQVAAALGWRRAAAERAGLTEELERLRFAWRADRDELPSPSGELEFTPEPADAVFAELFERVLAGTLDHGSGTGAARQGAAAQAREDLEFYRDRMSGERAWWRVARDRTGAPVGFGVPSRNPGFPVVGYLGVLPEQRGRGYAEQILGEITRILVAEAGATEIRADTDLANRPMAEAFRRAGYRDTERRLVLSSADAAQ